MRNMAEEHEIEFYQTLSRSITSIATSYDVICKPRFGTLFFLKYLDKVLVVPLSIGILVNFMKL